MARKSFSEQHTNVFYIFRIVFNLNGSLFGELVGEGRVGVG